MKPALATAAIMAVLCQEAGSAGEALQAEPPVYLLRDHGGRVDWSDKNNLLVADKPDSDGYCKLISMDRDGANQKPLTEGSALLPNKHHGNPAWHPSGKFIVFQVQDPDLAGPLSGTGFHRLITSPGAGVQNNIWIISHDARQAWQVTKLGKDGGVLHPHFSPDGSKLIWAERLNNKPNLMGTWVIKLADVLIEKETPKISNVQALAPGDFQWYETHGFSPDGQTIIFTGMKPGGAEKDFEIHTYHLQKKTLTTLTDPNLQQWDEHAHFLPDGKHIIWMSSMGLDLAAHQVTQFFVKTDYWIMDADGGNKRRLTFFNDPNSSYHIKGRAIASDVALSGDGKQLFAYVQDPGTGAKPGSMVSMKLTLKQESQTPQPTKTRP